MTSRQQRRQQIVDTVFQATKRFVSRRTTAWEGTMTEFRDALVSRASQGSVFPKSPAALRMVLNRLVRKLRESGVSISFTRDTSHMRTRMVSVSSRRQ